MDIDQGSLGKAEVVFRGIFVDLGSVFDQNFCEIQVVVLESVTNDLIGPALYIEAGGLLIGLRVLQDWQDLVQVENVLFNRVAHPDQGLLVLGEEVSALHLNLIEGEARGEQVGSAVCSQWQIALRRLFTIFYVNCTLESRGIDVENWVVTILKVLNLIRHKVAL